MSKKLDLIIKNRTYKDYQTASLARKSSSIQVDFVHGTMRLTADSGAFSNFIPVNMHVHAPSEHTIDGENYDLEIHFVHTYEDGSLGAVLGILFDMQHGGNQENFLIEQLMPLFNTTSTLVNNT